MKGWRTITANVLAALLPFLALAEWQEVVPAEWWSIYALGVALLNVLLRTITTTPVGRK